VRDRDNDNLIYKRPVISASLQTIEGAQLAIAVSPATEVVAQMFPIGNGTIVVPPATYKMTETRVDLTSPPHRPLVFGVHYVGGDLFDGTRNAPGVSLGLDLGRLTARASYYLMILKFSDQLLSFNAHDFSLWASYAYTPFTRTSVAINTDTLAARANALVTTTWQFGRLSAATLSVRGSSGSTFGKPAMNEFDNGAMTAVLSLQIGTSAF
jgi:hypothetical protein